MALTPENKSRWTAALRSGKYDQAHQCLASDPTTLCCIGVGYAVLHPEHDVYYDVESGNVRGEDAENYVCDPTYYAARALELETEHRDRLIAMNDDEAQNFHQIADWIDANL